MFAKRLLTVAMLAGTSAAWAVPFSPVDGRSFSMGGTGVANAKASSAGLFNPAMLAAQRPSADFSIVLPTVGVMADDSGNVMDTLSDIQDGSLNQLELAIDDYNNNGASPARVAAIGNAVTALAGDLPKLNNKPVTIDAGAGFGFAIPSKQFGFGLHTTANVSAGVVTNITAADIATLNQIGSDASGGALNCGASYVDSSCNMLSADQLLTSSVDLVGIGIGEVGLSFAHQFDLAGQKLSMGITPKYMQIETVQYNQSMGSNDEITDVIDDAKYRKKYTDFNVDLGAALVLGEEESATVVGIVAKNLLAKSYKTAGFTDSHGTFHPAYEIDLNTQIRAGIAKRWSRFNVAADIDITKNKGVGLNKDSQFLAIGGEMDLWMFQLRAGYRHNLVSDGVKDMATVGIGIGPLDISAMYADEYSYGANIQLGFNF
jgi:hypothetical protein